MESKFKLYRDGLGTLVGMIFGAGIFALPFSFARAGILWGVVHFAVALFFMTVLHLMYGEIAFLTEGQHRFTGYVRKFLGKKAEFFAFVTTIFAYHGTLLAYGILGGIFLNVFFPAISVFNLSIFFFVTAALFSLFRFERIGTLNFYLTIPLFLFVFYLFGISVPEFRLENFLVGDTSSWFLPYGIWLFALGGFASLPEARDILKGATLRDFKNVIIWSLLASSVVYFVFIAAILGVSGAFTTEDAISGLASRVGSVAILLGSLIGLIAVFTSYLAMAADLKSIFIFDYSRPKSLAWLLTVLPALLLFLLGITGFIKVLGLVGAVFLGILGLFIIEMARRLHKIFPEHRHLLLGPKTWLRWLLIIGLSTGIFLEIMNVL
ncbi:hypothetical protein IIA95_01480 [Patescibacteria group bacterium]|nr:hypothetical protein [Patescibacteria group bacterium]